MICFKTQNLFFQRMWNPLNFFFFRKLETFVFLIYRSRTWMCYSVVSWIGFTEINHTCKTNHCHQLRKDQTISSEQSPSWGSNNLSATQEIMYYLWFIRSCHWAISVGRWIKSTPWTNISYLFWIHYNIVLQSIFITSNMFWPFRFMDRNFVHISGRMLYALPKSLLHSPRFENSKQI
jgi:hypothetical protein